LFSKEDEKIALLDELKALEEDMRAVMVENERLFAVTKDSQRAIYHAKPSDKVDSALGKALNTFPERSKLKILFLRESEGVYRFG
jgi:hypothetical protein